MKAWTILAATSLGLGLVACRSGGADGATTLDALPSSAVLGAPLTGVDPRFLADFEELQVATRDGHDGRARQILERILEQGPTGPTLALAREFDRFLSTRVEPRLLPSIEALQDAVRSGNDVQARAILERLMKLHPTGPALELARNFETVLDGRQAVDALDLRIEATIELGPGKREIAVVTLLVRSSDAAITELRPGPATLHVQVVSVDPAGDESSTRDWLPFDALKRLAPGHDEPARVVIARVPVTLPRGTLALRATFDLELRSGRVRVGERDLPAQGVRVASGELVLLARELSSAGLATPADLALLAQRGTCTRRAALEIAVRVPRADREATLDRLAEMVDSIPEPELLQMTSALRWLAPQANLGRDAEHWRALLRRRNATRSSVEPDLHLPRRANEAGPGT